MGSMGFMEIAIIVLIALLLFGANRIAGIGRGLGEGIRHLRRALSDTDR